MRKPLHRVLHRQSACIVAIVRRPPGWVPLSPEDVPPMSQVLSTAPVASLDEALDDLLRCNRLSLAHRLDTWAVIHAPAGGW
ncbi:MAG: hypothetical protein MUF48_04400 [Pirellulaceae bacterium]|nr:hypothetical protein [Pirellulaceae bacterium]